MGKDASRRWPQPWPWFGVGLALAFVAVRSAVALAGPAGCLGDTSVYLSQARDPFGCHGLFLGPRPPVTALFYAAIGADSPDAIARVPFAQLALALPCWLWLAVAVARSLRRPAAGLVGGALVLLVGCVPHLAMWDRVVQSDSPALSLLVAMVAAAIPLLAGERGAWRCAALAVTGLLVTHARVVDAFVVGGLGATLLLLGPLRRHWATAATGFALLAIAWHGVDTNNRSGRWRFPLCNVVLQRVLSDPERTAWFAASGMPLAGDLAQRAGTWTSSDDYVIERAEPFAAFRAWVEQDLRGTLARYVATHPGYAVLPLEDADTVLAPEFAELRQLPRPLAAQRLPARWLGRLLLLATAAAIAMALWRRDRRGSVPLWLFGSGGLAWFVAWHGDAMEIARHTLSANLLLHLAIATWIGWTVDLCLHRKPVVPGPA